ncbi:MAG: hypothetical protein K5931_10810 [Lachnospiraceae bacterium]|nr:hypothetical protein [Lachnospiraceae bacterium]
MKRLFALIGAVILAGMYISTLCFALMKSPEFFGFLKASIAATIIVPVLIYGYILIYRVLKEKRNKDNEDN